MKVAAAAKEVIADVTLQDDLGNKAKKVIQGKIEALTSVYNDHKQREREQQMAVRYHRVRAFGRAKLVKTCRDSQKASPEANKFIRSMSCASTEDLQLLTILTCAHSACPMPSIMANACKQID